MVSKTISIHTHTDMIRLIVNILAINAIKVFTGNEVPNFEFNLKKDIEGTKYKILYIWVWV